DLSGEGWIGRVIAAALRSRQTARAVSSRYRRRTQRPAQLAHGFDLGRQRCPVVALGDGRPDFLDLVDQHRLGRVPGPIGVIVDYRQVSLEYRSQRTVRAASAAMRTEEGGAAELALPHRPVRCFDPRDVLL